jgi:hypothetical protein
MPPSCVRQAALAPERAGFLTGGVMAQGVLAKRTLFCRLLTCAQQSSEISIEFLHGR